MSRAFKVDLKSCLFLLELIIANFALASSFMAMETTKLKFNGIFENVSYNV